MFRKFFREIPIDVLCSNFVKFGQLEIGEIVRCLPDKNNKILSVCTELIAPKICQGQPISPISRRPHFTIILSEYFRCHPNRFIFGWVLAECVDTRTPPKRVIKWIQYSVETYSFEPNNNEHWNKLINWQRQTNTNTVHFLRTLDRFRSVDSSMTLYYKETRTCA